MSAKKPKDLDKPLIEYFDDPELGQARARVMLKLAHELPAQVAAVDPRFKDCYVVVIIATAKEAPAYGVEMICTCGSQALKPLLRVAQLQADAELCYRLPKVN